MECLARIINCQKLANSQLWKYQFLDIENNQKNHFYHHKQIDYDTNLAGKLSISSNRFLQSFKKEIGEVIERTHQTEILTELEGKARNNVDRVFNRLGKRKIELSSQKLHELHTQFRTWKKVSIFCERSEPTIYRWIKADKKEPQKRGRKPKFNSQVLDLLLDYNQINNTATQQERANYISQQIGQRISQQTISLLLKKVGITRKKLTYHYTQLDEEKAKEFNEETKPLLAKYPFLALDECSFYFNSDPRFGYSLKGERAINKKPSSQGEHYTLLLAVSSQKGVIHWELVKNKVDWKVFYNFLEGINLNSDEKHYLLLDNARIHYALKKRQREGLPSIKEQLLKKNIEALFITPYAPMLNPTELCFNLLRQQTEKQRPRNYEEMKRAIEKAIELLNQKDLSEYFKHCVEYFDKNDAKIELKDYH